MNGYFDQMHFIKVFKQFTGLTPTYFFENQLTSAALQPNTSHEQESTRQDLVDRMQQ